MREKFWEKKRRGCACMVIKDLFVMIIFCAGILKPQKASMAKVTELCTLCPAIILSASVHDYARIILDVDIRR